MSYETFRKSISSPKKKLFSYSRVGSTLPLLYSFATADSSALEITKGSDHHLSLLLAGSGTTVVNLCVWTSDL